MLERDCLAIALPARCILEVRLTEIWVILVLMPASVKPRVRVVVVDAKPIVRSLSVPFNNEFGSLRSRRWLKPIGIEGRSQLFCFDGIRNVLDGRDVRHSVEDIALELLVEVRVRVTPRVGNGHLLLTNLSTLRTGR